MMNKEYTGMIKFLLVFMIILFASCARQNYQNQPYTKKQTRELSSSRVTITGEVVGWDDIKKMPKK